jgi:Flp pilus assembly protein TadD
MSHRDEQLRDLAERAQAGDARALNDLGVALAERGSVEEAETHLRDAAASGVVEANFNLGRLLALQARWGDAASAFEAASRAGDVDSRVALGNLLTEVLRDRERGRREYRQAAEAGSADAAINLSIEHWRDGDHRRAEAALRSAIDGRHAAERNKDDGLLAMALAELLTEAGRTEEALGWFQEAVATGAPGARTSLGVALREKGDDSAAEAVLRQALAESDGDAFLFLGTLLADQKRTDEAELLYRHALEGGHRLVLLDYANLLADTGRDDEAESLYRAALAFGDTQAHNNLGMFFEERGELAQRQYELGTDLGDELAARNKLRLAARLDERRSPLEPDRWTTAAWRRFLLVDGPFRALPPVAATLLVALAIAATTLSAQRDHPVDVVLNVVVAIIGSLLALSLISRR